MFDVNEIKAMLENGTEITEIADQAAAALNAALSQYEKEKEEMQKIAEETARKARENAEREKNLRAAKIQDMEYLIDRVLDFMATYYSEVATDEVVAEVQNSRKEMAEALVHEFDQGVFMVQQQAAAVSKLNKILATAPTAGEEKKVEEQNISKPKKAAKPTEDPLVVFLAKNGLLS